MEYFEEMIEMSLIAHARLFLNDKQKLFSTSLQKIMINQKALDLSEKQVTRLKEKLQEHVGKDGKDAVTKGGPDAEDAGPAATHYASLNSKLEKIEKYRVAWAKQESYYESHLEKFNDEFSDGIFILSKYVGQTYLKDAIKKDQKTIEKIKENEPGITKEALASHPFLSFERSFLPILVFDAS